jgi:thiol-disulfide isomerase/thioredoxin
MFKQLFGDKLNGKAGDVDTETALAGLDAVGIYFSAHWCPPCRGFTPQLATKYGELKAAGKKFEIIFASSDSDKATFDSYWGEMPWLALPYDKRELKETLSTKYNCDGIPYLVILDGSTGEVITTNGRSGIDGANFVADFPWYPKLIPNITDDIEGLEKDGKCLIVLQDLASEETQTGIMEWLTPFAEANKTTKDFNRVFVLNAGGRSSFWRPFLGFQAIVTKHEHPLEQFTDFAEVYGHVNWECDSCQRGSAIAEEQHHCKLCRYDFCKDCIAAAGQEVPAELKVPKLCVSDLNNDVFYWPLAGKREATAANYQSLVEDMKADKLVKTGLGGKPE